MRHSEYGTSYLSGLDAGLQGEWLYIPQLRVQIQEFYMEKAGKKKKNFNSSSFIP
jgi:hypothetical protein